MIATVSVKGQVVIPRALRDKLGIKPGTQLDFREQGGQLVVAKVDDVEDRIKSVIGSFPSLPGEPQTTEEWFRELRGRDLDHRG